MAGGRAGAGSRDVGGRGLEKGAVVAGSGRWLSVTVGTVWSVSVRDSRRLRQKVRVELARRDRSMVWLAERMGVSRTSLYRWLMGKEPMPEKRKVEMARLLRVPQRELFGEG